MLAVENILRLRPVFRYFIIGTECLLRCFIPRFDEEGWISSLPGQSKPAEPLSIDCGREEKKKKKKTPLCLSPVWMHHWQQNKTLPVVKNYSRYGFLSFSDEEKDFFMRTEGIAPDIPWPVHSGYIILSFYRIS
jgi:hypothetical protein